MAQLRSVAQPPLLNSWISAALSKPFSVKPALYFARKGCRQFPLSFIYRRRFSAMQSLYFRFAGNEVLQIVWFKVCCINKLFVMEHAGGQ